MEAHNERTDPGLQQLARVQVPGGEAHIVLQMPEAPDHGVPSGLKWTIFVLTILIVALGGIGLWDSREVRADLATQDEKIEHHGNLIAGLQTTLATEVIDVGEERDRYQKEIFDVQRAARHFELTSQMAVDRLEEANEEMAQTVRKSRDAAALAKRHAGVAANRADQMEDKLRQLTFLTKEASEVFTKMVRSGSCPRDGIYHPNNLEGFPVWACSMRGERVRIFCNDEVVGFASECYVVPSA